MKQLNITVPKLNIQKFSKEENDKYETIVAKLASLGIYIRVYCDIDNVFTLKHPDGIHTYKKDAYEAQRLLENDKEIPQELLDRLAYYKPIIDKALNEK